MHYVIVLHYVIGDTKLGRELVREIAVSLGRGVVPEEWQHSKVVFIPKPNEDHKAAKGWRPINHINYIGKLAEKLVTGELQQAGLFHRGQYGGVKGFGGNVASVD